MKAFDVSSRPAAALGPKQGMRASASASARPASTALSGPMTTRSAAISFASATSAATSVAFTGRSSPCAAMPGLPGAHTSRVSSGDWAIFHASACSRPPDPTSRMFMAATPLPRLVRNAYLCLRWR